MNTELQQEISDKEDEIKELQEVKKSKENNKRVRRTINEITDGVSLESIKNKMRTKTK